MEENSDNCDTDTMPIPLLDVERKTIPVFCPWCSLIAGFAKTDVLPDEEEQKVATDDPETCGHPYLFPDLPGGVKMCESCGATVS